MQVTVNEGRHVVIVIGGLTAANVLIIVILQHHWNFEFPSNYNIIILE